MIALSDRNCCSLSLNKIDYVLHKARILNNYLQLYFLPAYVSNLKAFRLKFSSYVGLRLEFNMWKRKKKSLLQVHTRLMTLPLAICFIKLLCMHACAHDMTLENSAQWLSFEWSQLDFHPQTQNKSTLYSIIDSTKGK